MVVDDEYLNCSFSEGQRDVQWPGRIRLFARELPSLHLPSGQIVACDPLVFPEASALEPVVAPGEYPVYLTIAEIETDQRVAFARVQFQANRPRYWRHISQPGQDIESLGPEEFFGYPVDSGTGCFMDALTGQKLLERMKQEENYFEDIIEQMAKNYCDTWNWADIHPASTNHNVLCFSSGYGDGSYPSYLGISETGTAVCLLTDFQVFDGTSPRPA
jgi:hypothetical protein